MKGASFKWCDVGRNAVGPAGNVSCESHGVASTGGRDKGVLVKVPKGWLKRKQKGSVALGRD